MYTTYDDVTTFGTDRYAELLGGAEHDRLVRACSGAGSTTRRGMVFATLKLLLLRRVRSRVGKVAHLAVRT